MLKSRYLFREVSVEAEREFERTNVERKRERYLATNPLDRYATDPEYRAKVDRIAIALDGLKGPILDIGGNTAGESTILCQKGFHMVVGDINERALEISRERVGKFNLRCPEYVALDAHHLPFRDEFFSGVIVMEALHHFADCPRALAEILRVLRPGGILFSTEPNARNPLRRASEVRDRLRGTIEKSFRAEDLEKMCLRAGFDRAVVTALGAGRSTWKLQEVPAYRRPLARLHGWLSRKYPRRFGSLQLEARKAGQLVDAPETRVFEGLRSPHRSLPLAYEARAGGWAESGGGFLFPGSADIPILIEGEKRSLTPLPARSRAPGGRRGDAPGTPEPV